MCLFLAFLFKASVFLYCFLLDEDQISVKKKYPKNSENSKVNPVNGVQI